MLRRYAKLDLLKTVELGEGCTNVDLSDATRTVLAGVEARAFLRRLPTTVGESWAVVSGRGLRLTSRSGPDLVNLAAGWS